MLEAILVIVFYALVAYLCPLLLTMVSYKPVVRFTIEAPPARLVVPKPAIVPPAPMVVGPKIKNPKGFPCQMVSLTHGEKEADSTRKWIFTGNYVSSWTTKQKILTSAQQQHQDLADTVDNKVAYF
eukprot:TRINITY_DN5412_c0_g1_i2.p1 TRINITY_DN5412_c0_g1~~TRINITY_DN5412_c0_g1_i2.p1  ORF type:complete len:126 (+),score=19.34 TRINITY_DN5412_c0_g1_i2:119-496(+)